MSSFGEKMKQFRQLKGKSQKQLAKALGKSREMVSKYELGVNEPSLDTLTSLARFYGIPVDNILTDDEYIVINKSPELAEFEALLQDKDFVPYIRLAVYIKENNVDPKDVKAFVDSLLKYREDKNTPSR